MDSSTRIIKVLHVIDTGGSGGAETVFLNIAAGLDPEKFRSLCLVGRTGWLADALTVRGITPVILPSAGSFNFGYLQAIRALVREHQIDVIAAHLYGPSIYCCIANLLDRVPVISILHGQTDVSGSGKLDWLKRWVVRSRSFRAVFVSDRLKLSVAPALGLSDDKNVIIPNGIELSNFRTDPDCSLRTELGLTKEHILVGAVGNIRKAKAYEVFIRAAALLRQRSSRFRFAIAGETNSDLFENLQSLQRELNLQSELTFLGMRKDVSVVLRNYDVYALSSHTEGFSISCIEAMASGIPVVATRSGGPEDILEDGVSGLLVPTNDPERLAAAIEAIALNSEFAKRISLCALQRVGDHYGLHKMIGEYEKLFTNAVANG